ncbi:type II CAAX endopeptidase family protein [Bacillus carboniphilus]|uniref:Type II CAAX endopeptidase family protein n=1 Tax=Bacillus carboniphilus TaxID=86663 RepID=A0ABY9JWJ8_9BACI|nr:type II CAAX endopeptidase family protein [Bacillus carboniphilus]WLR43766.1 type II CAAX endopeptidase family protein [Bacillus carboniphilus]
MFQKQQKVIERLTDKQIRSQLYFTQALILITAIVLSFFLFDNWLSWRDIWGHPQPNFILIGNGTALFVILVDTAIVKYAPEKWYDDGGINEKLFQNRSYIEIFFLTALIAFCEELLFRGVLQTSFGLITASIIFALLHVRYLGKVLLFSLVVFVSFLLGVVYEITESILPSMLAHFLIDFVFALQIRTKYLSKDLKG